MHNSNQNRKSLEIIYFYKIVSIDLKTRATFISIETWTSFGKFKIETTSSDYFRVINSYINYITMNVYFSFRDI